MKVIFFGPQGCGKGTQANLLAIKLKVPHISTGDLLRGATGKLKEEVYSYMNLGKLVPSEVTIAVLKERLKQPDCKNGFILDGFPRNKIQAEALNGITEIDHAIVINLPDKDAIERIGNRRTCSKCGAVYSLHANPPKYEGVCDKCGGGLGLRQDDTEDSIKKRLAIYHQETELLFEYYDLIAVDGTQDIMSVQKDILKALHLQ